MSGSHLYRQLRERDQDRALLSLFAPSDRRAAIWALFLFQNDIARVRETVSDTHLGLIRLQWWRDSLTDPPPGHHFLPALATAIATYNLPIHDFETLLYAREFDLSDTRPAHLEGLVNYADFTNTPLLRLAQQITGEKGNDVAQSLGIAYGLTGIMRAVVAHARQDICLLPQDMLDAAHITPAAVCTGNAIPALTPVLTVIGAEAQRQLDLAVGQGCVLPPLLRATHRLVTLYLRQMRRAGFDASDPAYHTPPRWLALRVTCGLV
ncbi:MAG: squalene/phytoene synthase family protein [Pseudomonadota bacterium]